MNASKIIPEEDEEFPSDIEEGANEVQNNFLPLKSKERYEQTYQKFENWQINNNIHGLLSEPVFIAYFNFLAESMKSSSLWAIYSMLRSVVHMKHAINIQNYSGLIEFLKQNHEGYMAKKCKVLSSEEIEKFISEAPDVEFLATKVVLIFGVSGACRRKELCDITIDNIIDKGDMILVNVPVTNNDKPRYFVVQGSFYAIYKKYANLRPTNVATRRFFLNYRNGKCTSQVIGINNFGSMAKVVATHLKLKDPELYTGHTFRSSATILADTGADITTSERHGGWNSNTLEEGYIQDSIENKIQTRNKIMHTIIDPQPSSSSYHQPPESREQTRNDTTSEHKLDMTATSIEDFLKVQVQEPWSPASTETDLSKEHVNAEESHRDEKNEFQEDASKRSSSSPPGIQININVPRSEIKFSGKRKHRCGCCDELKAVISLMEANNKKLLLQLREEIISLRKELKNFNNPNMRIIQIIDMLKTPFQTVESFLEFELEIQTDETKFKNLQDKFLEEPLSDAKKFVRNGFRKLMMDNVAEHFTWRGTKEKKAAKNLSVTNALKGAFHSLFKTAPEDIFEHTAKKFFQYAKDRQVKQHTHQNQTFYSHIGSD